MEVRKAPVTKGDIIDLGKQLVYPPLFTRDQNMNEAEHYLQLKKKVLFDNSISPYDKILIFNQLDRNYELYKTKALTNMNSLPVNKINQTTAITAKPIIDIIQPISQSKRTLATNILKRIESALQWNNKGEIRDPKSGEYIEGTSISDLVRYEIQPNKQSTNIPKGYDLFKKLKHRRGTVPTTKRVSTPVKKKSSRGKKSSFMKEVANEFLEQAEGQFMKAIK